MKKIILECSLSVGDIVMLTAAVRDLHLSYPGRFITDVRTPFPELWENNPYITRIHEEDRYVAKVQCHYDLINRSNETPHHLIHGFVQFLNKRLLLNIQTSAFKGDIYLSQEERMWASQVEEITGCRLPFWVMVAGGKPDITIKWWDPQRYQGVVDHYRNRILFVQVGAACHHHPKLQGVIDFRGKTNLRQFIRLIYHADGVLCPVTAAMHLAAAIEVKPGAPKNRACVVIAGGREPSQWEAYPHHQFIHTNGALLCCDNGGCWKSRTRPLGDGDERDGAEHLCINVVGKLPRCMDLIPASEVIRRVGLYFQGGSLRYLGKRDQKIARRSLREGEKCGWERDSLEELTFRRASEKFIQIMPSTSRSFAGEGIVICAGGETFLPCAWVCVNMLRKLGCRLPVEIWHLGEDELCEKMRAVFADRNVRFIDAFKVRESMPARMLEAWPLKAYAIKNCSFERVLLLDADNIPVRNPEYLFRCAQFREAGAVFWPDFGRLSPIRRIWRICGVRYRDEPEFETGQILVNKTKCWRALSLALWFNEHADFYYQHLHGDKDTFHMAFRKLGQPYAMPETPIWPLDGVMCQHDFSGRRVFQHRNRRKWSLNGFNPKTTGFLFERQCLAFLGGLRKRLSWQSRPSPSATQGILSRRPIPPASRDSLG